MNLLRFLKSTKGAIKPLNALIISGAAGAVFAYTVNTAANRQIKAERAVRSLSNIEQTNPQAGMNRRDGMLTSINVRDGLNQVATAEERAGMRGKSGLDRYSANQRALENLEGSLGRAAEYSEGDSGLNTGNRTAIEDPASFTVGARNAVNVSNEAAGQAAGATRASGAAGQNQLASASMARASGSVVSGSFGGNSSSGATGGRNAGGKTAGSAEGYRLSGSMPGGSNVVSQLGLDGATARADSSSFGRNRHGRGTGGRTMGKDRDELKDILKKSAAAAGNANASANEGGRAFLAGAINSGGITVDGMGESQGASSSDLAAPTATKLKAVGNRLKQEEDKQEKRNKEQKGLLLQTLLTIAGSIVMMIAGAYTLDKIPGPWRWIVAAAMIAVVAAANALLMTRAIKFMKEYGASGGTGIAKMAVIMAPIMVAGMVYCAISPKGFRKMLSKIWDKIKAAFEPVGLLTSQVTSSVTNSIK